METGNLSVNSHASVRYWTPFGGFKQSGLGRELGPDALDAFTEIKNVFIATDDEEHGVSTNPQRLAGPGRRDHRRRQRHRAGQRAAAGRRGRHRGGRRHRRGTGKLAADEVGGLFVQADVTSEDDGPRPVPDGGRGVRRACDIAVNNAGISPPDDDSILTTGLDAWRRVQEVNLTSVYLCCKYVIPHMQRQVARARAARSSTRPRSSR